MTTKNSKFDGQALDDAIQRLPAGAVRMSALQEAIPQADAAKDAYWQLTFRYEYACEATFRDDPPKAMPAAAEFASIFEADPDALPEDGGSECYLMIAQMGIDPIVNLPQIPLAQWEALMEQFYALVKRYHIGLRTYWWQMARFWRYIDQEKAFGYFQRFWKTGRDGLSDCRACERSYAVQMSLMVGDRAAADAYAKPMEAGRIRFCSDTPQLYWLAYLEDALDRGDLQEAEPLANKLYRKSDRDKSDLSYLGAVLRCWAYTNPDRAVALAAKRFPWTLGMWDQKKVYDFYKGAWACFQELAKRTNTVKLELPEKFALYQGNGTYAVPALAEWFRAQAANIAQKFDQRNGTDWYAQNLSRIEVFHDQSEKIRLEDPRNA